MEPVVVDVSVEPDDDGLVVHWRLDGGDGPVDIATGSSPQAIDHRHARTAGAGERSARLPRLPADRTYVSVSPQGGGGAVVAAERRVPFVGVTNFRDLGGYRTADGRRTRWGSVFRADALHRFTADDRAAYDRLGLRAVYDFRGDQERANRPDPVPSIALALVSRDGAAAPADDRAELVEHAHGERLLRNMYIGMLEHSAPLFGRLLTGLADPEALPAVMHCTGGKDRTGMASALLLELLGVGRDDVLDDYEMTSRYRLRHHQDESFDMLVRSGMAPEAAAGVLGSPRWAMSEALGDLDRVHGGAIAYLTGPAGLAPETLDRLRSLLLV